MQLTVSWLHDKLISHILLMSHNFYCQLAGHCDRVVLFAGHDTDQEEWDTIAVRIFQALQDKSKAPD
ncbi:hypothetical protein Bpfe_006163 [Biomphalaria pfeifferi]|uniref:Uncharacterized protein n=1 Tax=Biomphalaria pfeifferi TaxID=112525 RepID=A0AAD8FIL8_BIOPF|nr:hypothetical protein Bpfe_006163 [Biomphalaria pfeifferi]